MAMAEEFREEYLRRVPFHPCHDNLLLKDFERKWPDMDYGIIRRQDADCWTTDLRDDWWNRKKFVKRRFVWFPDRSWALIEFVAWEGAWVYLMPVKDKPDMAEEFVMEFRRKAPRVKNRHVLLSRMVSKRGLWVADASLSGRSINSKIPLSAADTRYVVFEDGSQAVFDVGVPSKKDSVFVHVSKGYIEPYW